MDDVERAELAQRLTEVEERLDRIAARFTFGYGSESDRDGWLLWIRELTAQRDALRARLAGARGDDRAVDPMRAMGEPRAAP
jgi:hypothetical protein